MNKLFLTSLEKFADIAQELADEHGKLALFALIQREENLGDVDVVVSSPWTGNDNYNAIDVIANKITSRLKTNEIVMVNRVVILDPKEEFVQAVLQIVGSVSDKPYTLHTMTLIDVPIVSGVVVRADDAFLRVPVAA